MTICVLPRHNVLALDEKNDLNALQKNPQPQIFQVPTKDTEHVLNLKYPQDGALLQYGFYSSEGTQLPLFLRVKEGSLAHINPEQMRVQMDWVLLDWDLDSKGVVWGDPEKKETQNEIEDFIANHNILKNCRFFYFSKSGVRIGFELENPLVVYDSKEVFIWKEWYRDFVSNINVDRIGGSIEVRTDPFALNRVPNYYLGGQNYESFVFWLGDNPKLKADFPSEPKFDFASHVAGGEKKEYGSLPSGDVGRILWGEPLIQYLNQEKPSLSYNDWRGLGVNIACLFGDALDEGLRIFQDVSSWDKNYDAGAVDKAWNSITKSAEDYGPMTWEKFDLDLNLVYGHEPKATSSLAANIRRNYKREQSATQSQAQSKPKTQSQSKPKTQSQSKPQNNVVDVFRSLRKKLKKVNGEEIEVPIKDLTNLKIILEEDFRWKDQIWRNHLGSKDYWGDQRFRDELFTEAREIINHTYGLAFSKDDIVAMVRYIGYTNEKNLVCTYLNGLTWDGVDRIGGVGVALGQDDSDQFVYSILKKFLISAVVRPLEWLNYHPNVNWKIDTVLILKGAQGKRKSSFFKALCHDVSWFSDNLPSFERNPKDASMHMCGKWLVEQAEFEGHLAKTSIQNMKAFITREYEEFRKPYGIEEESMRRPSVLVGTTNSSSFLNDPTGDRRFWVLSIPDNKVIDLNWVRTNRDQVWAQAVHLYRQGQIWWLTDDEMLLSNERNSNYRRPQPLEEEVEHFLSTKPDHLNLSVKTSKKYVDNLGFTLKQLVELGLDKKLVDIKSYEATNIVSYLETKGWLRIRVRLKEGKRVYAFRKLKDFEEGNEDER